MIDEEDLEVEVAVLELDEQKVQDKLENYDGYIADLPAIKQEMIDLKELRIKQTKAWEVTKKLRVVAEKKLAENKAANLKA